MSDAQYDAVVVGAGAAGLNAALVPARARRRVAVVAERWGEDVLHCPYCHGYEVRDRPMGVLGTSPGAVHQVVTAAGMGSAAMAVNADLLDEGVRRAVTLHRAAVPSRAGGGVR